MRRKGFGALPAILLAILLAVIATDWARPALAAQVPTISVSGTVVDENGLPVPGATVQMVGNPSVIATTGADGAYTLAGLPSGVAFQIQVTKTGYENVYSFSMNSTANIAATYTLLPTGWSATVGNTAGLGMIAGRVSDIANDDNAIAGAVVTASDSNGPLPVVYSTKSGSGGSSTFLKGKFYVMNVPLNDQVTITATKGGITFDTRTAVGYADGLTEGRVYGSAASDTVWFTGWVSNLAGAAISGATVQLVSDSTKTTTTNTDGSFTLTGIPESTQANPQAVELKITKTNYEPSYVPLPALNVDVYSPFSSQPLFTAAQLGAMGNTTGNGVIFGMVSYTTNTDFGASGVTVTAAGSPSGNAYTVHYSVSGGTTGVGGQFEVFNVAPADTVTINASRPGFTFGSTTVAPEDGPILFMYTGSAIAYVNGCVRDKTTGAGISGAVVSLTNGSNNPAGSVNSASDGSFYLGVGALGSYKITASMPGYGTFSAGSVSIGTKGQTVDAGNIYTNPGAYALSSGWNLISLPLQPVNTAIASVLSGIAGSYQAVWAYSNGAWQVYDPSDVQGSTLTTMQAGYGYWIKMTAAHTLSVSGAAPSPSSISLSQGWNLAGYNTTSCAAASTALSSISSVLDAAWGYLPQGWQLYAPAGQSNTLGQICPGWGYWIDVSGAGTWTMPGN